MAVVRIAGAGPAGLACAIALAQRGIQAEVHEQRSAIGGRFGGGFQILPCFGESPHGFELLLGAGLRSADLELQPLQDARFVHQQGRHVELHSAEPYALLIRRGPQPGTLDSALARHATQLGVVLHTDSRLPLAQADVVATGPASVDGLALEALFRTDSPDRTEVLFDDTVTPGGYGYLMIRDGRGTLGVAVVAGFRELQRMLEAALARFAQQQAVDIREPRTARYPMSFCLPASATVDGRPHVGEAGGFQDYLFGLGLRPALVSGALAGQALADGESYDRLWGAQMRRRMLASLVDRYLFEHAPGGSARMVGALRGRDLRATLDGLYAAHGLKRALLPWVRWRWGAGRGGGRGAGRAGGSVIAGAAACSHRLGVHWCRARRIQATPEELVELLAQAQEQAH